MRTLHLLAAGSLLFLGSGCSVWNASFYPRPPKSENAAASRYPSDSREEPPAERLTLAVPGYTIRDVRLEGARVWGPRYEMAHFEDGYRGDSPHGFLFLSEKVPGRVSGVTGNGALTKLDYETDATTGELRSIGYWAWKHIEVVATHDTISVTRSYCTDTYRRLENTDQFVGRPDCWQAGRLGATLHVPDAFFERPLGEQIVFLTMFLA